MIREILIEAKKMIENPDAWIKGWPCGLRKAGSFSFALPEEANCYCASYAIEHAANKVANREARDLAFRAEAAFLQSVFKLFGYHSWVCHFNDSRHTTHEMVMQAFDTAIAAA